jgi:hypothetical protein
MIASSPYALIMPWMQPDDGDKLKDVTTPCRRRAVTTAGIDQQRFLAALPIHLRNVTPTLRTNDRARRYARCF